MITPPTDDAIFQALFDQVKVVAGEDWTGTSIPLKNASRHWLPVKDVDESQMPILQQLDPLPERDIRTGLGRSRRILHAMIDICMQRQDQQSYPDTQPFATILNNWKTNLYSLISPADTGMGPPNCNLGLSNVIDCYPIDAKFDYGLDSRAVAVVQVIVEIIVGG